MKLMTVIVRHASVTDLLDGFYDWLDGIFGKSTLILGLILLMVAIGIFAFAFFKRKQQPIGGELIWGFVALLFAGIMLTGSSWDTIKTFSDKTGADTLNEIMK